MIITAIIIAWLALTFIVIAFFHAGSIAERRDREAINARFHELGDDPRIVGLLRGDFIHHGKGH